MEMFSMIFFIFFGLTVVGDGLVITSDADILAN